MSRLQKIRSYLNINFKKYNDKELLQQYQSMYGSQKCKLCGRHYHNGRICICGWDNDDNTCYYEDGKYTYFDKEGNIEND